MKFLIRLIILKFYLLSHIIGTQSFVLSSNGIKAHNATSSEILSHDSNDNNEDRRNKIKEMMLHAWTNYKSYAWGKNELSPLSKTSYNFGVFGSHNTGATIIDALDTLYLMNLTSEYEAGRHWIATEFNLDDVDAYISVFETNIRFVGGFLSLYALTGDSLFKDKAKYVADKLLPAFNTTTGIPYTRINFKTGVPQGGSSILSDFGTLSLEFTYLSTVTGDDTYRKIVERIEAFLEEKEKPNGLYPSWLDPQTGDWDSAESTLGGLGDSFYEYLLKSWILSGKTDENSKKMFDNAMTGVMKYMVKTTPDHFTYLSGVVGIMPNHQMEHLSCFAGGLFALASNTSIDSNFSYLNLARELTKTCHALYETSPTELGPEVAYLANGIKSNGMQWFGSNSKYILRPETIESYFYLWRITHDPIYRKWGWEAVQALEKYCRCPHGYSGIQNVYKTNSKKDDVQQSFFLAETLKYLYLLYSDDDVLSLNEWVFNTEAHPLPILNL